MLTYLESSLCFYVFPLEMISRPLDFLIHFPVVLYANLKKNIEKKHYNIKRKTYPLQAHNTMSSVTVIFGDFFSKDAKLKHYPFPNPFAFSERSLSPLRET